MIGGWCKIHILLNMKAHAYIYSATLETLSFEKPKDANDYECRLRAQIKK